jgi:acetyltransferase-like isoleucine patch superfamily enzyme
MSLVARLKRLIPKRSKSSVFRDERVELIADRYPQYEVGRGSYGDLEVLWQNTASVLRMGHFCSVAKGVQVFLAGEHRPDWVTTYPFKAVCDGYQDLPGYPHTKGDVVIGNDVWICDGAIILSGVTIGDGAVIGARTVVARDVPPYAIVGGNPAKITRMRFEATVVERLQKLAWWDWSDEEIMAAMPHLLGGDIEHFLDSAEQGAFHSR